MSAIENPPAFPLHPGINHDWRASAGMSLRDWFAGQALAGLCGNPGGPYQACEESGWAIINCDPDDIAREAYSLADAMLRARASQHSPGTQPDSGAGPNPATPAGGSASPIGRSAPNGD